MSQPGGPPATCTSCGAPDDGEFAFCRFCKRPISAEIAARAIPCPNPACRAPCRWGKQRCAACQAWIVVSCIFCGAISPHNCPTCLQCQQPFAGAPQRKAAMEQQQRHQQRVQSVNAWGGVAGAFAGAAMGSHHHHYDHYDHYDHHHHHDHHDHHEGGWGGSGGWDDSSSTEHASSDDSFDGSSFSDDGGDSGGWSDD